MPSAKRDPCFVEGRIWKRMLRHSMMLHHRHDVQNEYGPTAFVAVSDVRPIHRDFQGFLLEFRGPSLHGIQSNIRHQCRYRPDMYIDGSADHRIMGISCGVFSTRENALA